jgi:hypothetical protein
MRSLTRIISPTGDLEFDMEDVIDDLPVATLLSSFI